MIKRITIVFMIVMSSFALTGCFRLNQHLVVDRQNRTGDMYLEVSLDTKLLKLLAKLDQENGDSNWQQELQDILAHDAENPWDEFAADLSYIKNYESGQFLDSRTGYLVFFAEFDIWDLERFFDHNDFDQSISFAGNRVRYKANTKSMLGTDTSDMRPQQGNNEWGWLIELLLDQSWYAINVHTPAPIISTNGRLVGTNEAVFKVTLGEILNQREIDDFRLEWAR